MHVLTKIFVVLVSLLAVLLVPLVVVYAHNEDNYKGKFQSAETRAAIAVQELQQIGETHATERAQLQQQLQGLMSDKEALAKDRDTAMADVRGLRKDVALATSRQDKITAHLSTITAAVDAGQKLMEALMDEVRTMRSEALSAERRAVELDEALRDKSKQLEVAVAARRAMQEEIQQLKEEHARALDQIAVYGQKYGRLEQEGFEPIAPLQTDLDATVVNVRRGLQQTLAEINAGSRDGIKEGWEMTIGRRGTFLGILRIITVDINRATGVVELEDPEGRGRVEAGDRVFTRAGRS